MLSVLLTFASTALLLATVAGSLPMRGYVYDITSHFMLQYAVAAAVVLILALFLSSSFTVGAATIALVLSLYQISPFLLRAPNTHVSGPSLRILQSNMLVTNRNVGGLMALIESDDPDVIVISEANSGHVAYLRDIMRLYPYQVAEPQKHSFGMAIASREPLNNIQKHHFASENIIAISADIPRDAKTVTLLSIHPANPLHPKGMEIRDQELAVIARWIKSQKHPVIVTGDFNITPYSHVYKEFIRETGLHNARKGRGMHGTYHSALPAITRLPIDHTLISDSLAIRTYRTAKVKHTDHLATVVTVVMQ